MSETYISREQNGSRRLNTETWKIKTFLMQFRIVALKEQDSTSFLFERIPIHFRERSQDHHQALMHYCAGEMSRYSILQKFSLVRYRTYHPTCDFIQIQTASSTKRSLDVRRSASECKCDRDLTWIYKTCTIISSIALHHSLRASFTTIFNNISL